MTYERFEIRTSARAAMQEITERVQRIVRSSGVPAGLCVVYVPHTTAGVCVNESHDPNVMQDLTTALTNLAPVRGDYTHAEGNSDSHIKAVLTGNSTTLIIENGQLVLGTWEGIFLCEFDGPRSRNVYVKILAG